METSRGVIFTNHVVHATNAHVAGLLPEYKDSVVPVKGVCCHVDVPEEDRDSGERAQTSLKHSYKNCDPENIRSYLIPRPDGSIIVGDQDNELISRAKDYFSGYMQRMYHGWTESEASVQNIWTGFMGYSFDSNPHIGPLPVKPQQFVIAGFTGHGMPVIWLAAKGLAKMIASGEGEYSFLETGIPRLFETTSKRIRVAIEHTEEDGDILGSGKAFPSVPASAR